MTDIKQDTAPQDTAPQDTTTQDTEQDEVTAQALADYTAKIEALDVKLASHRDTHINTMKHAELKASSYSDSQIDRYIGHIVGETSEEIKDSVFRLSQEIPPVDGYGDPGAFNGAKQKPKPVGGAELIERGRSRIKQLIDAGKLRL